MENYNFNTIFEDYLEKCKNNCFHEWCDKFKKLVQQAIHDRKEYLEKKKDSFDIEYINNFDNL